MNTPALVRQIDRDDWWTAFKVNSLGTLSSVQAFLARAAENVYIINISSAIVQFPPIPGLTGQSTTDSSMITSQAETSS
ncbi:hypothetical protein V1504DRAFT_93238 [Lipomyces starkeyi]